MRGRSKARSVKSRRRKPAAAKRPSSSEAVQPGSSSAAGQHTAIERLNRELAQARQEQAATTDVLRIISSSPGDLRPVFTTILDTALDLCEAAFGIVTTYDGERFEGAAQRGVPDALAAYFRTGMDQPRPGDQLATYCRRGPDSQSRPE